MVNSPDRVSGSSSYRRDIDGLRALAVAAVVCYHAFPRAAPGGFVGVDVFFVISGYLISGLILSDIGGGTFSIRGFYARRIRRIFPALIAVFVASLVVGWLVLLPNEYDQLGQHVTAGGGFCLNFLLWKESGYFDVAASLKPLLHLWSLGIEEQFYLVWPLLLLLSSRVRRSPLLFILPMIVLSFAYGVHTVHRDAVGAFYSPVTRIWELATGSALACFASRSSTALSPARRHVLSIAGLLLIAASIAMVNASRSFPGWWAALPVSGTALVIVSGGDAWTNRTLLSQPVTVFVGLISYPLYLWHWPALAFMRIISSGEPRLVLRLAAVVGSVLAAWATYRWIERPLRFGKARRDPRVIAVLAIAMAIMAAGGLAVHAMRGVPSRMPGPLRVIASLDYDYLTDARVDRCWVTQAAPIGFAPECVDPEDARPLVVVWGDSHAGRLYPGVRAIADRDGAFRVAQFARSTCPPVLDVGYDKCIANNAFVLARLRELKPAVVIMFAAWNQHSGSWRADDPMMTALLRTVHTLHDAGVARVLVVGPAPQWKDALPRLLLNASWRDHLPRRMRHGVVPLIKRIDSAMASALAQLPPGAQYVSAWQDFCDGDGCLTYVDDSPTGLTTWDYGHLTTAGATYLAAQLPVLR